MCPSVLSLVYSMPVCGTPCRRGKSTSKKAGKTPGTFLYTELPLLCLHAVGHHTTLLY